MHRHDMRRLTAPSAAAVGYSSALNASENTFGRAASTFAVTAAKFLWAESVYAHLRVAQNCPIHADSSYAYRSWAAQHMLGIDHRAGSRCEWKHLLTTLAVAASLFRSSAVGRSVTPVDCSTIDLSAQVFTATKHATL